MRAGERSSKPELSTLLETGTFYFAPTPVSFLSFLAGPSRFPSHLLQLIAHPSQSSFLKSAAAWP
jgi:hypothetical protein